MNIFGKIIVKTILIIGIPFALHATSVKELRDSCISTVEYDSETRRLLDSDNFDEEVYQLIMRNTQCVSMLEAVVSIGSSTCMTAKIYDVLNGKKLEKNPELIRSYFPAALYLESEWLYKDLAEMFVMHANKDPSSWQEDGPTAMSLLLASVFPCEMYGD